jgi:hypothetical protein
VICLLFQHVIDTAEVKEMFGQRVRIATAESERPSLEA